MVAAGDALVDLDDLGEIALLHGADGDLVAREGLEVVAFLGAEVELLGSAGLHGKPWVTACVPLEHSPGSNIERLAGAAIEDDAGCQLEAAMLEEVQHRLVAPVDLGDDLAHALVAQDVLDRIQQALADALAPLERSTLMASSVAVAAPVPNSPSASLASAKPTSVPLLFTPT